MENYYPIQVFDLRFQVDDFSPKKIQLFEEYRNDPANARLFAKIFRQRKIQKHFGRK